MRLGVPGVVHGVVIDTSWFKGNYPPQAPVEAASFETHPSLEELESADWASLENGGSVVDCSNIFYSSPVQILLPGRARIMGEGWENARRRDGGNDFVSVRLAAPGLVRRVEIGTSYRRPSCTGSTCCPNPTPSPS